MKKLRGNYKFTNSTEFIEQHRRNLKYHTNRMGCNRIPKKIVKYQPTGEVNYGRPMKGWKDYVF
jgi:hypothetical protein